MFHALDNGRTRRATIALTAANLLRPSNAQVIPFGDSGTSQGIETNGGGTNRKLQRAKSFYVGMKPYCPQMTLESDMIGAFSGISKPANFGIFGSKLTSMILNPRAGEQVADSPVGTVSDLGYVQAAQHPAAIIVFQAGANDDITGPGNTATNITNVTFLLNYWTNPANCGGIQKIVLLTNGDPYGIRQDGTAGSNVTNPAQHYAYSRALLALDYRQPGGIPGVIAVNTYDTSLDFASGTSYANKSGTSSDGLHSTIQRSKFTGKALGQALSTALSAMGFPDVRTPYLATTANPTSYGSVALLAGSTGTTAGGFTYRTGSGDTNTIPTGWKLTQFPGTGGTATVAVNYGVNDVGEREMVLTIIGAGGSATNSGSFLLTMSAAQVASAGIDTTKKLVFTGKFGVDAGSTGGWLMPDMQCAAASTVTANYYTSVLSGGSVYGSFNTSQLISGTPTGIDVGGPVEVLQTPICDLTGVGTFTTSGALTVGFAWKLPIGSSTITMRFSQLTLRDV